jgi:hypothetical protein
MHKTVFRSSKKRRRTKSAAAHTDKIVFDGLNLSVQELKAQQQWFVHPHPPPQTPAPDDPHPEEQELHP